MKPEIDALRGALQTHMQITTSIEADFEAETWTFKARGVTICAGDYLIIPVSDWKRFWDEASGASPGSASG